MTNKKCNKDNINILSEKIFKIKIKDIYIYS